MVIVESRDEVGNDKRPSVAFLFYFSFGSFAIRQNSAFVCSEKKMNWENRHMTYELRAIE